MDVLCPKCGTKSRMVAEENLVAVADGNVFAAVRNFLCPKCNKIFQNVGHHGTLYAKRMKTKVPKGEIKEVESSTAASRKSEVQQGSYW